MNTYVCKTSDGYDIDRACVDSGQMMIADVAVLARYVGSTPEQIVATSDGVIVKHDLAPGWHHVSAGYWRRDHWGKRIAHAEVSWSAHKEPVGLLAEDMVLIESDMLMFVDPCYILDDEDEVVEEGDFDVIVAESPYSLACDVTLKRGHGNIGETGLWVTSSGLGDGDYRVDEDDLTIYFLDDPKDEEDEDW